MEASQIWALTGITVMMWTVLFWTFKISVTQLIKKMGALVAEVKKLTAEVAGHHHRLDRMEDRFKEQGMKLEKHEEMIRNIELRKR